MSDQSIGVTPGSSPDPIMVPKERFDEVLARERATREQNAILQQILRNQTPQRPAQEEPEDMKKLREDNPTVYARLSQAENKAKNASAAAFQAMDMVDKQAFITDFGEEGRAKLQEVEATLNAYRQQGRGDISRAQIFVHMKGMESLQKKTTPVPKVAAELPVQTTTTSNVPSTDPSAAQTTGGGSASPSSKAETLAEMEKRLENVIL